MTNDSDNASLQDLTNPIAISFNELKTRILEIWVQRIKHEIPAASKLQSPIIIDTIPLFLRNLIEAIDGNFNKGSANQCNNIAEEHGGERARVTDYSPEHVVQEYFILREIVFKELRAHNKIDAQTESIILKSFDEAIQKSMMAFHLIYNGTRENIINHLTHDMRTPITAAKLSLDLLKRKIAKLDFESKENILVLVQKVISNIEYTNELIQNMLDESYLNSYKHDPNVSFQEVEMMAIISNAIEVFSEDDRKRIVLTGEKVRGFWESKSIRRMAENIIANAIKYGFENSEIKIHIASTFGRVFVSFRNEGKAIPVEEKGLLFNNFQRSSTSQIGKQRGWGLGLSYCREVAEAHAGSLGVESNNENGTTFTFDIPIDPRNINN